MSDLSIEYLPLAAIVKWPRNPKLHSPSIGVSIGRFGFNDPVGLNDHPDARFLLEGHGRVDALKKLKAEGGKPPAHIRQSESGDWLVPVVRLSLPPGEAEAYALAHNQITLAGDFDLGTWSDGLPDLLSDLADASVDLDGLGWNAAEIEAMLAAIAPVTLDENTEDDGASKKKLATCPRCGHRWEP